MNDDINIDPRLDAVDERLATLATSELPERDLWAGIKAGIVEPEETGINGWGLASLAATIMLGIAAGFWLLPGADQAGQSDAPLAATPSVDTAEPTSVFEFSAPAAVLTSYPGEAYGVARSEGLADLEDQLDSLPPAQRTIVTENLATIQKALAEIDAALAEDPDSKALKELLLKTYQQELETVNKVNRIAESVRIDL